MHSTQSIGGSGERTKLFPSWNVCDLSQQPEDIAKSTSLPARNVREGSDADDAAHRVWRAQNRATARTQVTVHTQSS